MNTKQYASMYENLTAREITIMQHVGEGLSNKEIARCLKISVYTVTAHLRAVARKTDESGRYAAFVKAKRLGLMP